MNQIVGKRCTGCKTTLVGIGLRNEEKVIVVQCGLCGDQIFSSLKSAEDMLGLEGDLESLQSSAGHHCRLCERTFLGLKWHEGVKSIVATCGLCSEQIFYPLEVAELDLMHERKDFRETPAQLTMN